MSYAKIILWFSIFYSDYPKKNISRLNAENDGYRDPLPVADRKMLALGAEIKKHGRVKIYSVEEVLSVLRETSK